MNIADRAAGAVIGALVGDALGVGPHWYYDLTELRKDYGDWIILADIVTKVIDRQAQKQYGGNGCIATLWDRRCQASGWGSIPRPTEHTGRLELSPDSVRRASEGILIPVPAVIPPVPVPPVGTAVVPIPVRSPVMSWSIVSGTIIGRTGNTHENMNSCLRFADRKKSPDDNHRENKKKLSHSYTIIFVRRSK
jgi:hypothetical protein